MISYHVCRSSQQPRLTVKAVAFGLCCNAILLAQFPVVSKDLLTSRCTGCRSRQKPKIDIILIKAPAFDEIVAAESQLQSSTNEHTASAVSSAAIAQSSNVAADEQIGFSAQHYEASEIALSMSSPLAHTAVQGSPLADGSTEEGPGQSERQLKQ